MQVTVTLDADVAAMLKRRRSMRGQTFKVVVDQMLRLGLDLTAAKKTGRRKANPPKAK
jgi:hypothetical protein